jgi:hypothetical protein
MFGLLLIAALVLGLHYYATVQVDRRGVVASGEVVRKKEYMRVRGRSWSPHLEVAIRYVPEPSSGPTLTDVAVDEATFDRLRVGSPVSVRYLPDSWLTRLGLAGVRLVDQPLGRRPRGLLGPLFRDELPLAATGLLAFALIVLWRRTRSWLAAIGAAVMALAVFTLIYTPHIPPTPSGPLGRARAVVREINRVTELGPRREEVPSKAFAAYQLVQLAFVPQSVGDTVVAMDAIDDGSVPGLAPGASVAITYSMTHPRAARVDGARRTFARTNLVGIWTIGSVVLAVIGLLLLGRASMRRIRGRTAGRRPPP